MTTRDVSRVVNFARTIKYLRVTGKWFWLPPGYSYVDGVNLYYIDLFFEALDDQH
jgi:hypothetical protein